MLSIAGSGKPERFEVSFLHSIRILGQRDSFRWAEKLSDGPRIRINRRPTNGDPEEIAPAPFYDLTANDALSPQSTTTSKRPFRSHEAGTRTGAL